MFLVRKHLRPYATDTDAPLPSISETAPVYNVGHPKRSIVSGAYLPCKAARVSNVQRDFIGAGATNRHSCTVEGSVRPFYLVAGAIDVSVGNVIIDGNTAFVTNGAEEHGGETHCSPRLFR